MAEALWLLIKIDRHDDDGPRCRILKVTVAPVGARHEEDRRER